MGGGAVFHNSDALDSMEDLPRTCAGDAGADQRVWGLEEIWDLPDLEDDPEQEEEETIEHGFRAHPSPEEVEDASRDLQQALSFIASSSTDEETDNSQASPGLRGAEEDFQAGCLMDVGRGKTRRILSAEDCNRLVQGMFMSIATNKQVWESVMADKKVQEFGRVYCCKASKSLITTSDINSDSWNGGGKSAEIFLQLLKHTKKAFTALMDNCLEAVSDIITGFLGLADESLAFSDMEVDLDCDPYNRAVKSCMVLAVLVLALVIAKRSAIVHATCKLD